MKLKLKLKSWKIYLCGVLFTEAAGLLSALLTREGTKLYNAAMIKPLLSPPPLAFPIAWTILYALMGLGAALVFLAPASSSRTKSLWLFIIQLAFNFSWSIIFFNFQAFSAAFFWLLILLALALMMTLSFRKVDMLAAILQIPYLLWLTFAGYLNFNVWMLN